MCSDRVDIAAVAPVLELSVDPPTALSCAGTLDARTGHYLIELAVSVLRSQPAAITIDIGSLRLADVGAADALRRIATLAEETGTVVRWHGVRADHLREVPTLRQREGRCAGPRKRR